MQIGGAVRIELLGGLRVVQNCFPEGEPGIVSRFRTHKTAALLAFLAYHRDQPPHARDTLIATFWPESDAGRQSLRQALSSLRGQLEPPSVPSGSVLVTDRQTVRLNPAVVTTDVAEFATALAAATQAAGTEKEASLLAQALTRYGGALLPGYYDEWILSAQERLCQQFFAAGRRLLSLLEQSGDREAAIACAHQMIAADMVREESYHDLIRLLAGAGRVSEALRQYRTIERLLDQQMGGESPSPALQQLARDLERRQKDVGGEVEAAPVPTALARPAPVFSPPAAVPVATTASHLPPQFTRFIGRETEIADLSTLLLRADTRLATLSGVGGTGKTRLALEAASRRLLTAFSGAVWFVALADRSDPRLIASAIADALRLPRSGTVEPFDQVVAALADRPAALLILDNFEHLISEKTDSGADVVADLLARAPTLTCLVTSRRLLGIAGEHSFALAPLPTPPVNVDQPEPLTQYASVRLFVDRAQAARPDFQITRRNAQAVADLCRRLEGIPLAIELAAARAQVLTPAQIIAQMERRFDFLVSRRRGVSERHKTLRAAIEWSYRLLSPPLQHFFCRLSVFRGGWTLEAAAEVCEEPGALDFLEHLQEACLVLANEDDAGTMRFRMLETLREFGQELMDQAGAGEALRYRHLNFFAAHVTSTSVGDDMDNVRFALAWSLQTNDPVGIQIAESLRWPWIVGGHYREAREWAARLLELPIAAGETLLRARALCVAGHLAYWHRDYLAARPLYEETLRLFDVLGERVPVPKVLGYFGNIFLRVEDDLQTAREMFSRCLSIAREIGDTNSVALGLFQLSGVAYDEGDVAQAIALCKECLVKYHEAGNDGMRVFMDLGIIATDEGDYDAARKWLDESLLLAKQKNYREGWVECLINFARIAIETNDCGAAASYLRESLGILKELEHPLCRVEWLHMFAQFLTAADMLGGMARAVPLYGAADALRERYQVFLGKMPRTVLQVTLSEARKTLGDDAFAAAWKAGRALTWEEAVAYALQEGS